MKKLIFPALTALTLIVTSGFDKFSEIDEKKLLSYKIIDANNISTVIWNDGMLDKHWSGSSAGFEWPKGTGKTAIYTSGLWLSSKVNDSIRVSIYYYNSEFTPGYFDYASQTAQGYNDPAYRVYKVSPDFPSGNSEYDSWNVWPVNQGAPWIDNNNNGIYEPPSDSPLLKGTQNFFCSFTDGYLPSGIVSRPAPPLRAEIHLYAWSKEFSNCADAVNYEYKIINKNRNAWTDMSAALWSDTDLGTSINDKAGTDSLLNLIFVYNGGNVDPIYGTAPPSVGYVIKEASGHGLQKSDYASKWGCPEDCPIDSLQRYRVMHGLRVDGSRWVNPVTNTQTNFPHSGDPVSQSGWIDSTQGERYCIIGSIFGNVLPLDTIEFSMVTFIKRGGNNLLSVAELKNCVSSVISVNNQASELSEDFMLYQNYPNPFNQQTKIKYNIIKNDKYKLEIYDILGKKVDEIFNKSYKVGNYEINYNAGNLSSGIYIYKLSSVNNFLTKKLLLIK